MNMKKKYKKQAKRKILLVLVLSLLLVTTSILAVSIYRKINGNEIYSSLNQADEKNKIDEKANAVIASNMIVHVDIKFKKKEKVKVPEGSKFVALTFDDGPGYESTQRILDVLSKYNAKATWFVLGSKVDANPDMLKKIDVAGHEVANHSYNHPNLVNLDLNTALQNINSASSSIKNVIGKSPAYLRPPYGSYNDAIVNNMNMKIALWSVDSLDWKYRNGQAAYEHVMSTLTNNPVVLFHDIYDTSADAVELLVPRLVAEGYTFITYNEMMSITGG